MLTNQQINTITIGLQNIAVDKEGMQRDLPMLPSVRLKRMLDDLEGLHKSIKDAKKDKEDQIDEKTEELKEKVDDEDSDYTSDDMREEINELTESLEDEMEDFLEQEVEVEFTDPLTEEDINRIDSANNYPFISSSAIEIILKEVINESE